MRKCPICDKLAFSSAISGLVVNLPDILCRWEEAVGCKFPQKILEEYQKYQHQPLELKECAECGFGRFEPVVSGSLGFYECISATDYYNDEKWEFGSALSELQIVSAKRILDVGCGTGLFLDYLKERIPGADLFGYDLNSQLLADLTIRGFGVLSGDLGGIKKLADDIAPFDAICMLQVLEHACDPVDLLQTFLGLLRSGGVLIITTPNASGPIKNFPDALTEIPPHHITRWTDAALRILLQKHNLRINVVRHEPLPDYLWDSYLPVMWDEPIWPAQIFDPLARRRGMVSVGERAGFAAKVMKDVGLRWLHGVPGHTIFISAILE